MTTIIATRTKILSDGKVTVGSRIDSVDTKKVRNVSGYLIGGAGRYSSILTFFEWYQQNLLCQDAQSMIPGLSIMDDSKEDEQFTALVVHPDGVIYLHEGSNPSRAYPLDVDYYAIGSGADFALAALKGGATPEEAMEVAKQMDVFSGGETFVEELQEQVELTREVFESKTKKEILDAFFPKEN